LLDCYLGLTGQKITYLSLSKKSTIPILHGFIGALISPTFLEASRITKDSYRRSFSTALKSISLEVPTLDFEVNNAIALKLWQEMKIDPLQKDYYKGWTLNGKNGNGAGSMRLAWIWNTFGPEAARALHSAGGNFSERYDVKSKGNFVPVFNDLVDYLEKAHSNLSKIYLGNSDITTKFIEGFCRDFFESKDAKNNCLETTIKRWNDSIPFLETILFDSGVFERPYRRFPYIQPSRKIGAETKISTNREGVLVKDKLIVDVPLNLTDDEVLKLLFQEINNSVDIVLSWASQQAKSICERFKTNGGRFDFKDFDLDAAQIRSKYRQTTLRKAKAGEIAYRFGLPTSYSLDPFMYLLINEHPLITESFLLSLQLYDKHGILVGLEKTENCTYLIGYKKRKGGKKALQRVLLTEKSSIYVEQLILLTQPLRNYLKAKGDDNYRYLFLTCGAGFSNPSPISSPTFSNDSAAYANRLNEFEGLIGEYGQLAPKLVNNLSFTKFRATVGLQVYLETGSAKAMSEALGHSKYKPELLSHYLPEPILAFFQSRWIRIFQKGIICESMKDSPLLLRASNFVSMEEMDKFLNLHVFSIPNDPADSIRSKVEDAKAIYISVDENVLTALLSIKSAVQSTDPHLVSGKALYWSKFSSLLEVEIEKNMYDPELSKALKVAQSKANPDLMRNVVIQNKFLHSTMDVF